MIQVTVFVGRAMWTCRRAADMATFQFGAHKQVRTFKGEAAEVGEYALHVQCPWRIIRDETILVGSGDLYYPADDFSADGIPNNFNWDRDPNRRDHLLGVLFESGTREFMVEAVDLGKAGTLRIDFEKGFRLELFPSDSSDDEHWRLFGIDDDRPTLVVEGPSWPS